MSIRIQNFNFVLCGPILRKVTSHFPQKSLIEKTLFCADGF